MKYIKVMIYGLVTMLFVTGCYIKEATSFEEEIEVVETKDDMALDQDEAVESEPIDSKVEAQENLEEPLNYLDLSNSQAFALDTTEVMGAYHDQIEVIYPDDALVEKILASSSLDDLREHLEAYTYNMMPGQIGIVSDPSSIYALSNKLNRLPSDYEPETLVMPDVDFSFAGEDMKRHLRPVAADALVLLFEAASEEGLALAGVSGYRSYNRQNSIYTYNVDTRGVEVTDEVSARPGHSEHQTGLAIDVSTASVNYRLDEVFGQTEEGLWLKEHAHEFGFIIRYEKHRQSNTGYVYEPWHIRYIGEDVATFVYENDVTLEMLYGTLLSQSED